jgi:multiple sugar transport system permease protein
MDGCSRLGGLVRVVLPAAIPGVLTAMLFSFTLSWNEFIYAVMFVSSTAKKTLGPGVVVELIRGDVFYWGELMAGAVLGSVPIAVAYAFLLDYYISGLTAGAVK